MIEKYGKNHPQKDEALEGIRSVLSRTKRRFASSREN